MSEINNVLSSKLQNIFGKQTEQLMKYNEVVRVGVNRTWFLFNIFFLYKR